MLVEQQICHPLFPFLLVMMVAHLTGVGLDEPAWPDSPLNAVTRAFTAPQLMRCGSESPPWVRMTESKIGRAHV